MAYNQLISNLKQYIRENGNEEITGQIMQDALIAIVKALSTYQQFGGMAEDVVEPDTENNVFYFALKGTYPQFGGLQVGDYEIGIFISYEDPEELDEEGDPVIKWKDVGIPVPPGPKGDPGRGVPNGGTIGQVLAKQSDEDGDTEWVEPGNITVDPTPTEGSTNPVQSGGVFDALEDKPTIYYTTDIQDIPPTIIAILRVGDIVRFGSDYNYIAVVCKIDNNDVYLVATDGDAVETWIYRNGAAYDFLTYQLSDFSNKVPSATQGNLAGLDADGNLTDSGKSSSDFATAAQGGKADTAVQPSDLATVATSGSYNDLLNKPTIPAAQVNSDWNANSGVAQILNKPTIPDVSGKADKVVGAISGDVATLDGNGNLTDSGLSVFDFFVMVEDASTPPASMAPNTVYQYGTLAGNTTFPPLATPTEPDIANVYCWTFATPATAPTITWPVAITSWAGGSAPTINASKSYEVSVMDGLATIIEA